jgi:succinate dehydrogenase / fumarate reductase, membrane anchor subunit
MWTVLTDYLTTRLIGCSALFLRTSILAMYALINFAFIVWGVEIIWGY